jgi:hypothetical protein
MSEVKTAIEDQILEAADYVDKLEGSIKERTGELRQQLKDARQHLKKLLAEKRDGQMTIPLNQAMKK